MAENTKRELPNDLQEAEAVARADESRASILRRKALTDGNYKDEAEAAAADAHASSEHYAGLRDDAGAGPEDLSGVTRGLSDSAGNFAATTEVLQAGGIGVEASNTNVSTGQPAQTADEAGQVEIPTDWEGSHWQTRVALAKRISGRDDVKTDEANDIIAAEVERRS